MHVVTLALLTVPLTAHAQAMAFPVVSLVRFWANHHLLDVVQRPCWRVVKGRSRNYVLAITSGDAHPHMGSPRAVGSISAAWQSVLILQRVHKRRDSAHE